jgi:hypothetical protein
MHIEMIKKNELSQIEGRTDLGSNFYAKSLMQVFNISLIFFFQIKAIINDYTCISGFYNI